MVDEGHGGTNFRPLARRRAKVTTQKCLLGDCPIGRKTKGLAGSMRVMFRMRSEDCEGGYSGKNQQRVQRRE